MNSLVFSIEGSERLDERSGPNQCTRTMVLAGRANHLTARRSTPARSAHQELTVFTCVLPNALAQSTWLPSVAGSKKAAADQGALARTSNLDR